MNVKVKYLIPIALIAVAVGAVYTINYLHKITINVTEPLVIEKYDPQVTLYPGEEANVTVLKITNKAPVKYCINYSFNPGEIEKIYIGDEEILVNKTEENVISFELPGNGNVEIKALVKMSEDKSAGTYYLNFNTTSVERGRCQ